MMQQISYTYGQNVLGTDKKCLTFDTCSQKEVTFLTVFTFNQGNFNDIFEPARTESSVWKLPYKSHLTITP